MAVRNSKIKKIAPPPSGTIAYVAGILGGIASGSSRPKGFGEYFGTEGSSQLFEAFQEIDSFLTELNGAGVGSGQSVTVRFD